MRITARVGAKLPFVSRKSDLFPTDMAEVIGIISVVMRETKCFAEGLTLFLRRDQIGLPEKDPSNVKTLTLSQVEATSSSA